MVPKENSPDLVIPARDDHSALLRQSTSRYWRGFPDATALLKSVQFMDVRHTGGRGSDTKTALMPKYRCSRST